ncbi:hypothetical protein Cfor_02824, partial [Coptotermes formosanus]
MWFLIFVLRFAGNVTRRRRSSLAAQFTDMFRDLGGSTKGSRSKDSQLHRRETLADIAKSLSWGRSSTTDSSTVAALRKRRESSADSSIKHPKSRRDSTAMSNFRSDLARLWLSRRESTTVITPRDPAQQRRGSGESSRSGRRDSTNVTSSRRGSGEPKYYRQEQRPSTSSTASDSGPSVSLLVTQPSTAGFSGPPATVEPQQALPPPTIITSSTTPPATSPSNASVPVLVPTTNTTTVSSSPPGTTATTTAAPTAASTASTPVTTTHPLLATRRDSTTQVYYKGRRDSRTHASPERRPSAKESSPSKFPRLPRQSTAIDESGPGPCGRRGSQPTLSPDLPAGAASDDTSGRKARRDSLSPDSASYTRGRRDSRSHLSPDRSGADRDVSPVGRGRRGRLRRQSTSITGGYRGIPPRSPESSSTCSSRDPSPCNRAPTAPTSHAPVIRRQSTTEEILIARGFRRQSTTEEMIRCRNFRRQSSQSEDLSRSRGRRDSAAQILDGTFSTMTVETTSTFFDTSTQT